MSRTWDSQRCRPVCEMKPPRRDLSVSTFPESVRPASGFRRHPECAFRWRPWPAPPWNDASILPRMGIAIGLLSKSNRRGRGDRRENESSASVAAAAVAFLLVLAVALAAAEPPIPPFAAGVLRRDGVVVPFAVFDGKSWSARWPKPALDLTVPTDVASVPPRWWGETGPLDTWHAWIGAAEPRPLKVVQPDWIDVHCVRQIGLHTDYRPDQLPPPTTEQPYPKDGLAIAPPRPVEPVVIVPPGGPESNALLADLKEAFNRAERQPASKVDHPV